MPHGSFKSILDVITGIMVVGLGALIDLDGRNFLPDEILMKVRLPKAVPRRKLSE